MEINKNLGGTALFALRQALRQPREMVATIRTSGESDRSSLANPLPPPAIKPTDATGKGSILNLLV